MGNRVCVTDRSTPFADGEQSFFTDVFLAPPDPILNTAIQFKKDMNPNKINLGVGAYRTDEGKPYILPVVLKAEEQLYKDACHNKCDKEYSQIDGPQILKTLTQNLLFTPKAKSTIEDRMVSVQTLSGTGSLRVCGEFIKMNLPPASHTIWIPDPTWGNHLTIFKLSGFVTKTYRYYDEATKGLNFQDMMADLRMATPGNCVLLHACAHNPTGVDPTEDQWREILQLCKDNHLIPIMDSAYQGYASGDLDKDAFACRLFEQADIEMLICQSFAKNLGMYGERIGMLHVVCKDKANAERVLSQLKAVIRPMYSSPPIHGAQLVMKILGDTGMLVEWKKELKQMAGRILEIRSSLQAGLERMKTPGKWDHITAQIGMFSYTGLTKAQCERLIEKHHIYLLKSGRISLAGLNNGNLEHMIKSVDEVVRAYPA